MFIGETEYYSKNVFLLFVVLYSLESTLIIKNIIICSSFENQWKVMLATYIGELYAKVHSNVDDFFFTVRADMIEERYTYQQLASNQKWSTTIG